MWLLLTFTKFGSFGNNISFDKNKLQVSDVIEQMLKHVDVNDIKIKEELARLEGLKSQLARKEEFKAENNAFIAKSHAASKELIKLAQDYGYKF